MRTACLKVFLSFVSISAIGGAAFAIGGLADKKLPAIGYVIDVEGKWIVQNSKQGPVTPGMAVSSDTIVKRDAPGPTEYGSISIVLSQGRRVTYSCSDPKSMPVAGNVGCTQPISFAAAERSYQDQNNPGNPILAAIAALLSNGSPAYFSAVSRGAGTLEDAVVELKDGVVDFEPAFGSLNRGDYTIAVDKIEAGQALVANPSDAIKAKWDPDNDRMVNAPVLAKGLYRMRVTSAEENTLVGDVWVLVTTPETFTKKKASFEEVKAMTASWSGSVASPGVHTVQRAALDALSRGDIQ